MRGVTVVQDLDQRYNALLQMYGEKVEEAQELRMDLVDVKDLYKSQVPAPRRIYTTRVSYQRKRCLPLMPTPCL